MSTRSFSEDQLEALTGFPDIGKDELIRFFTLAPADVACCRSTGGGADLYRSSSDGGRLSGLEGGTCR